MLNPFIYGCDFGRGKNHFAAKAIMIIIVCIITFAIIISRAIEHHHHEAEAALRSGLGLPLVCDGVVGIGVGMASASSTGDVACMTNSRKSVVCRYSTTTHFPIE